MANRIFSAIQALNKELKVLSGRINLSAAAAVTTVVGRGFTVAKTGTGLYTITLQDKYGRLDGFDATYLEAAASANIVKMVSESVNTSPATIVLKTCPSGTGTPTDIAAAASIFFTAILNNRGTDS